MFKIIAGLVLLILGFIITWKSEWLLKNFGANSWAETKLATSGGSRMLYKLIGMGMMLIGILVMTGLVEGIILGFMRKFFMFGG